MFRDAVRTVTLVAAALGTAEFDAAALEARAGDGWTTLTELADTLVRDRGLPFGTAHSIARHLVAARSSNPTRPMAELLAEASAAVLGEPIRLSDVRLTEILSPRHFVAVRRTWGGPAPEETARASEVAVTQLATDAAWWRAAGAALQQAAQTLRTRSAEL
jgi:argininosuccinate lyase